MIAYLDLPSGLSGDMFLGCLVDCGWSPDRLRRTIESLSLPGGEWALQIKSVQKGPLRATLVDVLTEESDAQRRLADIQRTIERAPLPPGVRERSLAVFGRLADAEAKVHGTTRNEVHFHEVGGLDAIIDIVGVSAGLHDLGIERVFASAVPLGEGWVETAHGRLPLPSPATLELLASCRAPTRPAPGSGELVTPTGAALLAEFAEFRQPSMTLSRIGLGAGQKTYPWPNVARMWIGDAEEAGPLVKLETNIDDMNPQLYADVAEKLFAHGARDVWLTPVQMKKGRPAVVLSVLTTSALQDLLSDIILRETTTLGVRVHGFAHRHHATREMHEVQTPFGSVAAKVKRIGDEAICAAPEYEDCRKRAGEENVPILRVYQAAVAACEELMNELRKPVASVE